MNRLLGLSLVLAAGCTVSNPLYQAGDGAIGQPSSDLSGHSTDLAGHVSPADLSSPSAPDLAAQHAGGPCARPGDCGDPTPYCCAYTTYGGPPQCARSTTVSCTASCPFQFPLTQCNSTAQAALCEHKSDCKDPAAANCCVFNFQGGGSGSVCVSDQATQFGQCLN